MPAASWRVALALCLVSACCAAGGPAPRARRAAPAAFNTEHWLNFISEYTRGLGGGSGAGGAVGAEGAGGAIPIQLPQRQQGEAGGSGSTPVLLIPFPVPVPGPAAQCPANMQETNPHPAAVTNSDASARAAPAVTIGGRPGPAYTYNTPTTYKQFSQNPVPNYNSFQENNQVPAYNSAPAYTPDQPNNQVIAYNTVPAYTSAPTEGATATAPLQEAGPSTAHSKSFMPTLLFESFQPTRIPMPPPPPPRRSHMSDERLARNAPKYPPAENSRVLLEQFHAQVPTNPMLPPVVIDPVNTISTEDYTIEELVASGSYPQSPTVQSSQDGQSNKQAPAERRVLKCKRRSRDKDAHGRQAPPPLPTFERSLFLRARLTVPRADYTEPYSVWWDAASGAARMDFHGRAASTYRMVQRDGRVQSVQIRTDRTGEADVRRCLLAPPRRVALAERRLPALPDLRSFSFAGHVTRGAERAERWRHTLSGHSGELGGARGEALTFRHELLVRRAPDNRTATPLRYSVAVDSSALGTNCDGYVHVFDEVQIRQHDTNMFHLDIADACEQLEQTNRVENVEPLFEFTSLRRDPRYDTEIEQYKRQYERSYADDLEEAIRKNVFMQTSRFVSSGNREGASFKLIVNFLADRLTVERHVLLGSDPAAEAFPGDPFPHSKAELDSLRGRLPRRFDWRQLGGVTRVRNQHPCSTCWAFATVGAVEGALFAQTGRLVPLSEQTLVDCGKPYGTNGCNASWPSRAYNYIKDNGLPALDEYPPYQGAELQCRADSVPAVTRISGHLNVTTKNILALKVAIKKYGPTVVIIDAMPISFQETDRIYYHDARCRQDSPNHAVLAVGWTVHRGETYFLIKNSWSAAWGAAGYVYMRASANSCGILNLPSVPRLSSHDVMRVPAGSPSAATFAGS